MGLRGPFGRVLAWIAESPPVTVTVLRKRAAKAVWPSDKAGEQRWAGNEAPGAHGELRGPRRPAMRGRAPGGGAASVEPRERSGLQALAT
jgi:hypothetical protein